MSIEPNTIHLKDYKRPDYLVDNIYLTFDLAADATTVTSEMEMVSNFDRAGGERSLVFNGEKMELISISIEGQELEGSDYTVGVETLVVDHPEKYISKNEKKFRVEIKNKINPIANKALEGLYQSGDIYCTQNEPEGFRRITYFIDRPDNMSTYTTKIIGDENSLPVMLSNGNLVDSGKLEGGKHFVVWKDPFPKPSYLYALVAGNLGVISDEFTTCSGRKIDLKIYCDLGNEERCEHAMVSLKKSMKWDEEIFGREYDLDIFMIVAVDSFNMGAMENKGLNIFNSHYVLANLKSATDDDFLGIESVVGHEYFHNWTGNRITCRDWFQLTLKEGLTVFRDQEFSSDMNSRSVQRIEDVQRLKSFQFREDAGPMAHPIRPASYIEINNFYTATVYEKGSEVIRMIHTLLGREGFSKGMDKYFELFDGQAVTTEDFISAMEQTNDYDFTQFKRWYSQAGTPKVSIKMDYHKGKKEVRLNFEQSCPSTPGQAEKEPFVIPMKLGLLGSAGREYQLPWANDVFSISKNQESVVITGVDECPVPSFNRNFSAPVEIDYNYSEDDLLFLMSYDSDDFNRYEAGQKFGRNVLTKLIEDYQAGRKLSLPEKYIKGYGAILNDREIDPSFKALCLSIPPESLLLQQQPVRDYEGTYHVRQFVKRELAKAFRDILSELYQENKQKGEYQLDHHSIGMRQLKLTALAMLCECGDEEIYSTIYNEFSTSSNMTEEFGALAILSRHNSKFTAQAVQEFYDKWKGEMLVMTKWLAVQGSSPKLGTIDTIVKLQSDPVYDKTVPNLLRSLIGAFAGNIIQFNRRDGSGYKFIADQIIEIDPINPSMASGLSRTFRDYKHLDPERQERMKEQLGRILEVKDLSKNTFEIISKTLK